jgi:hypothetical protein
MRLIHLPDLELGANNTPSFAKWTEGRLLGTLHAPPRGGQAIGHSSSCAAGSAFDEGHRVAQHVQIGR